MPSVRIEDVAFGDLRYPRLAAECGLADADHAIGKMARLWRQCTAENQYQMDPADVIAVLGPRGVEALVASRLGEVVAGGKVRIRGTRGRIEWLETLRENGRKGGRPRTARVTNAETKRKPSGSVDLNPLAPVLVLAPSPSDPRDLPDVVVRLWAEQERLRAEAVPGSRGLELTADRRKRIRSLLESGHTEEALLACLREYAREERANRGGWFNGDTNWRPDNVARTLGRIGTRPNAARGSAAALDLVREAEERHARRTCTSSEGSCKAADCPVHGWSKP